mgnify:CR=1 FL=1
MAGPAPVAGAGFCGFDIFFKHQTVRDQLFGGGGDGGSGCGCR